MMFSRRQVLLTGVGAASVWLSPRSYAARPSEFAQVLEKLPRDRALRRLAEEIARKRPLRFLASALLLAACRQIRPRPYLGPNFHAVLVMPWIMDALERLPERDRAVSLLWAGDLFEEALERYREEGGTPFTPPPTVSGKPTLERLERALLAWDEAEADRAIVGLHRSLDRERLFERLWRFGARDYRDIGHKPIFLAGVWRATRQLAWADAQPLLRSLVSAILRREDPPVEVSGESTWQRSLELAQRPGPKMVKPSDLGSARALLRVLLDAPELDAVAAAAELAAAGAEPNDLWDAIALASADTAMQRPSNIVALHAVTTANALRLAYRTTQEGETRRLLFFHAVGRTAMLRAYAAKQGPALAEAAIDRIEAGGDRAGVEQVMAAAPRARPRAMLAYLAKESEAPLRARIDALMVAKAVDAHDYKLPGAMLEDVALLRPEWRARYFAAVSTRLRGSDSPESERTVRAKSMLKRA